ncbi:MAG: transposase [Promethearchaeota archaeon]
MPKVKRKKEYCKCCLVLQDEEDYKHFYRMRIAIEQHFTTLKKDLFLESHRLRGLEKLQKHLALRSLCILVVAVAALRMGHLEAICSPKYFQH